MFLVKVFAPRILEHFLIGDSTADCLPAKRTFESYRKRAREPASRKDNSLWAYGCNVAMSNVDVLLFSFHVRFTNLRRVCACVFLRFACVFWGSAILSAMLMRGSTTLSTTK